MKLIRFSLVAVLMLNVNLALAKKLPGYILVNSSDTIFGEIRVPAFDTYSGAIVLFGINLEPMHSICHFRENGTRRFKLLTPKDIPGFGFDYQSTSYHFKSFAIETNSVIASESIRYRFLNLIFRGELAVYRDIVRSVNFAPTGVFDDAFVDHYDYYLHTDSHGLERAVWTRQYPSLKALLQFYDLDQRFLDQLPSDLRFKDVKEILLEYEKWKNIN